MCVHVSGGCLHLWALLGAAGEWIADDAPLGRARRALDELVVYALVHERAGARCAALALRT